MKLDLNQIKTLEAIDRLGSFQAAAEALHKAKSAVSYTIKQMEEVLGIEVFDRTKQKARLTDAGQLLLKEGSAILNEVTNLEEKIHYLSLGWQPVFRIAYDESLKDSFIMPLVDSFYQSCKRTNLEIVSHTLGGCWDALLKKKVDCAIGVSGIILDREDYVFKPLQSLHFLFVVGANHPLAQKSEVLTQKDLDPYTAIFVSDSSGNCLKQNYDTLTNQRVLTVSSILDKAQLISDNVGVGFLPASFVNESSYNFRFKVKEVKLTRPSAKMMFAYHQSKDKNKALQWWINQICLMAQS
jgi:DNA-binding transcriptional LysR family regulator